MGYLNSDIAKKNVQNAFFFKLSLFEEVGIFFIISFKNKFHWYSEILHFSGFVVLRRTAWAFEL